MISSPPLVYVFQFVFNNCLPIITIVILARHWCFDTPWVLKFNPQYSSCPISFSYNDYKMKTLIATNMQPFEKFGSVSITPQLVNSDHIYKLATGTSTLIHMMINHHFIEWENYKYINYLFFPPLPQTGLEVFWLIIIDSWVKC